MKNLYKATLFSFLGVLCWSLMSFLVKFATVKMPVVEAAFFRFAISCGYLVLLWGCRKMVSRPLCLHSSKKWIHFLRAVSSTAMILSFYTALKYMALSGAMLLVLLNTLFIPLLNRVFFSIKIPKTAVVFLGIAFAGIACILHPSSGFFHWSALLAILASLFNAISMLALKHVSQDPPYISMSYYFPFAALVTGIFSYFQWQPPSVTGLILALGAGLTGILYQECLIRAMRYAPAYLVSSLLYGSVIVSVFLDHYLLAVPFTPLLLGGIVLVCLGNMGVLWGTASRVRAQEVS